MGPFPVLGGSLNRIFGSGPPVGREVQNAALSCLGSRGPFLPLAGIIMNESLPIV